MKKFIPIILLSTVVSLFCACEKKNELLPFVSEIRNDVLLGNGENFSVKAYLMRREYPFIDDGNAEELIPYIRFTLENGNSETLYRISFSINGLEYSSDFSTEATSGDIAAFTETQVLPEKTLTVNVSGAGITETIILNSCFPPSALSPENALDAVYKTNAELFDSYRDGNGNFNAEIRIKFTYKNDRAYYFFGIITENSRKAFLVDAYTAEVLAVRNVF